MRQWSSSLRPSTELEPGEYRAGVFPLRQHGTERQRRRAGEVPYAAAIFMHRFSYDGNGNSKATSGCVSLNNANLVSVLLALQPGVMFAIGTPDWLLVNT